jgi:hypothetical protein
MAYKIVVDIVDPRDGEIKVTHIFWGHTETEARTNYAHHLAVCDYFSSNAEEGEIIEEEFVIPEDDIPVAEVEGEQLEPGTAVEEEEDEDEPD